MQTCEEADDRHWMVCRQSLVGMCYSSCMVPGKHWRRRMLSCLQMHMLVPFHLVTAGPQPWSFEWFTFNASGILLMVYSMDRMAISVPRFLGKDWASTSTLHRATECLWLCASCFI